MKVSSSSPSHVIADHIRGWLRLMADPDGKSHFADFPDNIFGFLTQAAVALYSTRDRQLHCSVVGDQVKGFLCVPAPQGAAVFYLHLQKDHYQPYVPSNYTVPPGRPLPLEDTFFSDLMSKTELLNFGHVDSRAALETNLNVVFRFDGKGSKINVSSFPQFRLLLDCEVETVPAGMAWEPLGVVEDSKSLGSVSVIDVKDFELADADSTVRGCPEIIVTPLSESARAVNPCLRVVWGGRDAFRKSDTLARYGVKVIIQIRNSSKGLGADIKPDFKCESTNVLLLKELMFVAENIHEQVESGHSVAVQCLNGRTRSPTGVGSYMVTKQQLSYDVIKPQLDNAMAKCHGDCDKRWEIIDRESRFVGHLQVIQCVLYSNAVCMLVIQRCPCNSDTLMWTPLQVPGGERRRRGLGSVQGVAAGSASGATQTFEECFCRCCQRERKIGHQRRPQLIQRRRGRRELRRRSRREPRRRGRREP